MVGWQRLEVGESGELCDRKRAEHLGFATCALIEVFVGTLIRNEIAEKEFLLLGSNFIG